MFATWLSRYFKKFLYANQTIKRNDVNVSNSNLKLHSPAYIFFVYKVVVTECQINNLCVSLCKQNEIYSVLSA